MSGITVEQRATAWNIKFFINDIAFAGIFQNKDCVTVGDVTRDLDLCLVSNAPASDQAVLLPRHTDPANHIQLDRTNTEPFPAAAVAAGYTYLFHSHTRCAVPGGQLHTRDSDCYQKPPWPTRRHDPRYFEIGKPSGRAGNVFMAPLRNTRRTKRSASGSRNSSLSSTQSEVENEEIPIELIAPGTARSKIDGFRTRVLTKGRTACAISGKGKPWFDGMLGMGIEAAHIIPQLHWAVYPLTPLSMAIPEDKNQLEMAWRRTWLSTNGLPLLSHLHKCFDARLVTIHPLTKKVRAFVDYDVLADHHGQQAYLASVQDVDSNALQHHYDMCCIENMVAEWVPDGAAPPAALPTTPSAQALLMAPPQVPGPRTATEQGTLAGSASSQVIGTWQASVSQQPPSGNTTRPSSPPASDSRRTWWLRGSQVVEDAQEAAKLRQQGWILYEVSSEEEQRQLLSKRRWIWGDQVIEDPKEARSIRKQGWSLQEVMVGSEEEYRLLAGMGKRIWLYGSDIIDDPQEAADMLQLGLPLHEVSRSRVQDEDRGRASKKRRCTATLDEGPPIQKQRHLADLSPNNSFT
ncbi:unnamed protein product [Discula destructiva]